MDCIRHHAVLSNRAISSRVQIALFVPGFPLSALAPFSLCGQSVSLVAILAALSLHPKIPFLADRPWRSKPATFATLEPDLGGIDPGRWWGRALLLRIKPKRLELPTPFRRSIPQPFNVDLVAREPDRSKREYLQHKERNDDRKRSVAQTFEAVRLWKPHAASLRSHSSPSAIAQMPFKFQLLVQSK
jgi:hypothetical protein